MINVISSSDRFCGSDEFTRDDLKQDMVKYLAFEDFGEILLPILKEKMDNVYALQQNCQDIFTSIVDRSKDDMWLAYPTELAGEWYSYMCNTYGDPSAYLSDMVSRGMLTADEATESQYIYEEVLTIAARIAEKLNAVLEENQEPGQYQLVINSDSTGNNTASMALVYMYENMFWVKFNQIELSVGPNGGNAMAVVYDSVYGGYCDSDGDYFYTRTSDNILFMLDTLGTYDIPVDPSLKLEDYWTMFDIKISYSGTLRLQIKLYTGDTTDK